jgi:alkanesulfonate monooxygenase SsuD/methylene tetrahydromethanopterin reductase-like flavin-dependent oxidoreductase (luciferase family)
LTRRRPVKLARETVSLDHLSDGRLVLGVGIGHGPWEWDYLGEQTDLRVRGEMLDEVLDLLVKLWTEWRAFDHIAAVR